MFAWLVGDPKVFVGLPLPGVKGRLFVSPMPWGPYDTFGILMRTYRRHRVNRVVMLVTDAELERKARRDIIRMYESRRMIVTRFPIADLTKPAFEDVTALVSDLRDGLRAGQRVVIHCNAGVGRTGTIAACVVGEVLNLNGDSAIEHIRQYMKVNLVDEQLRLIRNWADRRHQQKINAAKAASADT